MAFHLRFHCLSTYLVTECIKRVKTVSVYPDEISHVVHLSALFAGA